MTSPNCIITVLTNRDYGPLCHCIAMRFFPVQSSRRLNIAYPRGDIARIAFDFK